jgi:uncharacterized protein (TIGR02118 family)
VITVTFCLRRLPRLTLEEFQRYWYEVHAPLVRELAPVLRLRRYVQLHALRHLVNEGLARGRGSPEPFDGIAELTWDSLEDLLAPAGTPEGRQAGRRLVEDERRFIDLARSPLWVNQAHVVVGEGGPEGAPPGPPR